MWRLLGAAVTILTIHCLPAVVGDECAQPRPFRGTSYKGCVWEACSAESDTGVCTFSSDRFLGALEQYQGLNLTASEDILKKCVNAGRVLLSMVPGASAPMVDRSRRSLQELPERFEIDARQTFSDDDAVSPSWRPYLPAQGLSRSFDVSFVHRLRVLLSVGERTVLQAPTVVQASGEAPAVLPEVLDKVSECPTELPDGVNASNETLALLQFVSEQCHNVDNVPSSLVFGDVVDASQLSPTATVCLPSAVSLEAYLARVQCQMSKPDAACLVSILEMWSIDSSLAQAVANSTQAANNTCARGYAEAGAAADAEGGAAEPPLPQVSRQGCLIERSASVDRFLESSWPRGGSANIASGAAPAGAFGVRWWFMVLLVAASQWC